MVQLSKLIKNLVLTLSAVVRLLTGPAFIVGLFDGVWLSRVLHCGHYPPSLSVLNLCLSSDLKLY